MAGISADDPAGLKTVNGETAIAVSCLSGLPAKFDLPLVNRHVAGFKRVLSDGGCRVPLIVKWPEMTPAGGVSHDLTDLSDLFTTFAEVGGADLPPRVKIDGHSFAPQLRGEPGEPRTWVYVEWYGESFARDARHKLTNRGEMLDMRDAPFKEIPVSPGSIDSRVLTSRARLQEVLAQHPARVPT